MLRWLPEMINAATFLPEGVHKNVENQDFLIFTFFFII